MRNLLPIPAAPSERIAPAVLCPAVAALAVLSAAGPARHAVASKFIAAVGAAELPVGGNGLHTTPSRAARP